MTTFLHDSDSNDDDDSDRCDDADDGDDDGDDDEPCHDSHNFLSKPTIAFWMTPANFGSQNY